MLLNSEQMRYLRGLAHHLKPVVMVGQKGVSETVLMEVDQALTHHELIKVSIACDDREERQLLGQEICAHCRAESIQRIGKITVLYRPAKKPKIQLPR
jgi:RNA-binding protein